MNWMVICADKHGWFYTLKDARTQATAWSEEQDLPAFVLREYAVVRMVSKPVWEKT